MTYEQRDSAVLDQNLLQREQYQKQRQQQQLQEYAYLAPGRELPEKQHQSKHNPISESGQFDSHSCDQ